LASSTAETKSRPVFVLTGTSGEGKSTLAKLLVERVPEVALAISATTRPMRPGEEHGRDYWFVDDAEFDRALEQGGFLEWVELPWGEGYRSGTLWKELERITAEGRSPVLEIETNGALAVRDRVPAAVTIFVTAPSREERERRLRLRATESEGEIDQRLDIAEQQSALASEFDYTVVNDDRERAVGELEDIVRRAMDGAGTMPAHDPSPH